MTDDERGLICTYLGEGESTAGPLHMFGEFGVVQIPGFQALLGRICANGYEHHVAVNRAQVADALDDALTKYTDGDAYHHKEITYRRAHLLREFD